MLYFVNDYSEGAHPKILEALIQTNEEQHLGYGMDLYCQEASELIKKSLGNENVDIHFLVAGTQTNTIAISAFLKSYEAVIATEHGHIAVHETGAIEATGHKIIEMPSKDGKLKPHDVEKACNSHLDEHMVKPRLVYISNATELGDIYTKSELIALRKKCDEHDLLLFLDGARLANALTCKKNDLTIQDICDLTDAFYIGGTKNGILFGEAIVIKNPALKMNFRYVIKQRGGLLAKGRLLGVQFKALFENELYFKIAQHTNEMAEKLRNGLSKLGYKLAFESTTNLIFVILHNDQHEKLSMLCHYESEAPYDDEHMIARFVTSFATKEEDVDKLLSILSHIGGNK